MKTSGIFNSPDRPHLRTLTSGIFRNPKKETERAYQINIYENNYLKNTYKTDSEQIITKLEEMANEEVTRLQRLNPSYNYELKYIYKSRTTHR